LGREKGNQTRWEGRRDIKHVGKGEGISNTVVREKGYQTRWKRRRDIKHAGKGEGISNTLEKEKGYQTRWEGMSRDTRWSCAVPNEKGDDGLMHLVADTAAGTKTSHATPIMNPCATISLESPEECRLNAD
jgi:hypothetical protein